MVINKIKITQTKSKYGRLLKHQNCLSGLGIKKINKSIIVDNTPENRGMINKICYLITIEDV
jgi:large subunit ribosomal protein L30